jgi:hypothetical protein
MVWGGLKLVVTTFLGVVIISNIPRIWGVDPGSLLGNPLQTVCAPFNWIDRAMEEGGGGGQDAEQRSIKEQIRGGAG